MTSPDAPGVRSTATPRFAAMDALRGLVMALMAVDHASGEFNAGRAMRDTLWFGPAARPPLDQFLTRFVTHLCAPTFLFLAGASLQLFLGRESRKGTPAGSLDRHLLVRGLVILLVDLLLVTPLEGEGDVILQVMFAIGVSFWLMIPTRRLPVRARVALGVGILLGGEAMLRSTASFGRFDGNPAMAVLLGMGFLPFGDGPHGVVVFYSVLPWFGIMLLGTGLGAAFEKAGRDPAREKSLVPKIAAWGAFGLLVFTVVRFLRGYGDHGLHRTIGDPWSWLQVSKYPPSVAFVGLELGLACLLLAAFLALDRRHPDPARRANALVAIGQAPFIFYVLHLPLLAGAAHLLGVHRAMGVEAAWLGGAAVTLLLLPVCVFFRRRKHGRAAAILRYF